MQIVKHFVCAACMILLGAGVLPVSGGELTHVSGPAGFGEPPTGSGFMLYGVSVPATQDGPVDAVFEVAFNGGVTHYNFIATLLNKSTVMPIVGVEIALGFGVGDAFTAAEVPNLSFDGAPMFDFTEPTRFSNTHVVWDESAGVVVAPYGPSGGDSRLLIYNLMVPDVTDEALVPAEFLRLDQGHPIGYQFTLRHAPIYVPEPASAMLLLCGLGLIAGRRHRRL